MFNEESVTFLDRLLPTATAQALGLVVILVLGEVLMSSSDFFSHRIHVADQETLRAINQLCRDELRPFTPGLSFYPMITVSRQTIENSTKVEGSYCPSLGGAMFADQVSLYHLLGKASQQGLCDLSRYTQRCVSVLKTRVDSGQQQISPDFESRINALFKKLETQENLRTDVKKPEVSQ